MVPLRVFQIPLTWIVSDVFAISKDPQWVMRISFFIYCSRHMILESVEKLFWIHFGDNPLGSSLDFALAPIITFSIIIVIAFFLRKLPIVWTLFNGGESRLLIVIFKRLGK